MKRVYSAPNITMVGHVQNILESSGIPCVIKNQYLAGATGELPPIETWPELWCVDESQYDQAMEIVDTILKEDGSDKAPWVCPKCNEKIEGQFSECWKCSSIVNQGRHQNETKRIPIMKKLTILILGIISLLYLLNIGVGVIELIPDNIPIIGNLDEATATILLLNCLRYFGIDLFNIFKKEDPDKDLTED